MHILNMEEKTHRDDRGSVEEVWVNPVGTYSYVGARSNCLRMRATESKQGVLKPTRNYTSSSFTQLVTPSFLKLFRLPILLVAPPPSCEVVRGMHGLESRLLFGQNRNTLDNFPTESHDLSCPSLRTDIAPSEGEHEANYYFNEDILHSPL